MCTLGRLLGKDVVTLIYREVHRMYMTELVAEYRQCIVFSRGSSFYVRLTTTNTCKSYNYRDAAALARKAYLHVINKHFHKVAQLPKNY